MSNTALVIVAAIILLIAPEMCKIIQLMVKEEGQ